ncbi:hypothetical protein [uncultured Devosia sp.]|uniref:hypothetical protein n=1 Tax=uncultured Devosia sp. TaxID=211434 RepID=UPI0035CC7178
MRALVAARSDLKCARGKGTAMTAAWTLGVLLAGLGAGAAMAAPPSAEQKAQFYATCMGIAQDAKLCSCKADAALTLIDADFMAVVINSMRGKTLPVEYSVPYNTYVGKSNQVCKPNY